MAERWENKELTETLAQFQTSAARLKELDFGGGASEAVQDQVFGMLAILVADLTKLENEDYMEFPEDDWFDLELKIYKLWHDMCGENERKKTNG